MGPSSDEEGKAQQILYAVQKVLALNGYAKTTIALVAAEAGVSRGLLHYYFKNKEEMLAKAIRANVQFSLSLLRSILEQSKSAEAFAASLTAALREVMENHPEFFHLFFEGLAVSRQSELVRAELGSLYGSFRETLHDGLKRLAEHELISPVLPLGGLAALLTGILDGMAFQLMTDPDLIDDDEIWESTRNTVALLLQGDD
jgi:AcrR family transcriptional regulator